MRWVVTKERRCTNGDITSPFPSLRDGPLPSPPLRGGEGEFNYAVFTRSRCGLGATFARTRPISATASVIASTHTAGRNIS